MNQNLIIGIIVVIALLAGGYFIFTSMSPAPTGGEATTTVSTTDNPTPGEPSPAPSPSAPSVVTDTNVAPTNSTAVVTGKVTPNGDPTTYWYEYGASTSLGQRTSAQNIGSGYTAIPSPGYITGLSANTTYYFRLSAKNSVGTVNGATYSFSTNNNPPGQGTPPAASTNAATALLSTGATLNGHVNAHSSQTTYWFEFGTTPSFGQITSFQSGGTANVSNAVSTSVSGLVPVTKYYFRIDAQNQYGTVNGTTQSFTTTGPAVSAAPVVTTQVASPIAATTATLRGTVNPTGSQTTYWFEYSKDSLFSSASLQTTPQKSAGAVTKTVSIEANVSGLTSKTTYYYRTVGKNALGTVRGDVSSFETK